MSDITRQHVHAMILSACLTTVVFAIAALFFVDWAHVPPFLPSTPTKPVIDQSIMVNAGVAYVKTLPAYTSTSDQPVLFDKITKAENGVYLVEFTSKDHLQAYRYVVFWQDSRIIGHEVHTEALDGLFNVISPEPGEIVGRDTLVVRGMTQNPQQSISAELKEEGSAAILVKNSAISDVDKRFSIILQPLPTTSKALTLLVDGSSIVTIPLFRDAGTPAAR